MSMLTLFVSRYYIEQPTYETFSSMRTLKPFSHDQKKNIDSLRRILRAGIVYLIIPRLTAFASFHTTQCNNSTNVPRETIRMYRYSWLPLNYRIFGLNHRKYQWNDYVSLACGARVRVCVTSAADSYDNVNIRKNGRPTRVHTWNCAWS